MTRKARILRLAAIISLGLVLRSVNAGQVWSSSSVVFYGSDPYYHARRVSLMLDLNPAALSRDPCLNHPQGAAVPWPPGFDMLLAGLATLTSRFMDLDSTIAVAMPLLGAAAILILYFLAKALLQDEVIALISALLLAVLPAHAGVTLLARVDHHGIVAILLMLHLVFAWKAANSISRNVALSWLVGAGAASFMLFFSVPAVPWLYLVPVAAGAATSAMLSKKGSKAMSLGRRLLFVLSGAHGLAAGFLILWLWAVPPQRPFDPSHLSYMAVLWCLGLSSASAASGFVSLLRKKLGPWSSLVLAGGIGSLLHAPALLKAMGSSSLLLASDPLIAGLSESRPLLDDPVLAMEQYSVILVAFPAIAYFTIEQAKSAQGQKSVAHTVLAWLAFSLAGLTLIQQRFSEMFAPIFALAAASWIRTVLVPWTDRTLGAKSKKAVVLVLVLCLLPCTALYARGVKGGKGPFAAITDICTRMFGHAECRSYSPGALAPWSQGNAVMYRCGLATLANSFATKDIRPGIDKAADILLHSLDENENGLDSLRYWFVQPLGSTVRFYSSLLGEPSSSYLVSPKVPSQRPIGRRLTAGYYSTIWARLAHFDGSRSKFMGRIYPGLGRFRLLDESGPPLRPGPGAGKLVKLYERVQGFQIKGEAEPGSHVLVSCRVMSPSMRKFTYLRVATTGADGRFGLIVPYPTYDDGKGAYCLGPYKITTKRGKFYFETSR